MPADSRLLSRIHRRLAELEAGGLARSTRLPSGIDLSSNDYLALAKDPRVTAAFAVGAARAGVGSTGSRLLRGEREVFMELERRFADFKGTDRALFLSSGYLANLAVLSCLAEAGDVVFSDERNHASLIDATRLCRARTIVCPHGNVERLAAMIEETPCDGVRFVVVESLYSMDGDVPPLDQYAALCEAAGAMLVVDEAHAVGVFGERGSGLVEAFGLDANRLISINTGGKALGVAGALIAGPAWAIEYLMQRARPFVFSTAAPPAVADALQASLAIVAADPERRRTVRARAQYLRHQLRRAGVEVADGDSQIVPVLLGDNERAVAVARAVQDEGFDVRAIRPPTVPPGTARLRVSVNAGLSEPTLDRFVTTLVAALAKSERFAGV